MPNYRRAQEGGATYFFTVVTYRRQPVLMRPDVLDALRAAFRRVRTAKPFKLDAIVVLADHLHAIWTLPPGDAGFGARWGMIKRDVSKSVVSPDGMPINASMASRLESGLWQRRFWEHLIRNDDDYARHMDYIHYNPVKHGYANSAADWPHSSFRKCVERGIYPMDWAGESVIDGDFGE
jgi:putative transposase